MNKYDWHETYDATLKFVQDLGSSYDSVWSSKYHMTDERLDGLTWHRPGMPMLSVKFSD